MWNTGEGERTFKTAEWALFRTGLHVLWGEADDAHDGPDDSPIGVRGFDRLKPSRRMAMLALVGSALSRDDVPAPELTAVGEATIAAVFACIRRELAFEVDMDKDPSARAGAEAEGHDWRTFRRLVLAAHAEPIPVEEDGEAEDDGSPAWSPPDLASDDLKAWDALVEDLENRVLWEDGDHELAEDLRRMGPAERRRMMATMNIDEAYLRADAPKPDEAALEAIRATLRAICQDDVTG